MSTDKPEASEMAVRSWFPEPMSDEAAFAIHQFLAQFSYQFEGAYYTQITRYQQEARAAFEENEREKMVSSSSSS